MFTKGFSKTAGFFEGAAKMFRGLGGKMGATGTQAVAKAVKTPTLARNSAEFSMSPSKFTRAPGASSSDTLARAQLQSGVKKYSEI